MKAIVTSPICPLMTRPSHQCRRGDEALFGMTLEVLEDTRTGWYQVEAPYRYGGYAPADCLLFGDSGVRRWADLPKQVVCKAICDVLSGPAVEFWPSGHPDPGGAGLPRRSARRKGLAAGGPPRRPGGVYKM